MLALHILSRIHAVGWSLAQLIFSCREKRQGVPRAWKLEADGGLELLELTLYCVVQHIQHLLTQDSNQFIIAHPCVVRAGLSWEILISTWVSLVW